MEHNKWPVIRIPAFQACINQKRKCSHTMTKPDRLENETFSSIWWSMPVTSASVGQKDKNHDWPTSDPVSVLKKSKCKPAKSRSFPAVVSHSFIPVILPVERLRQREFDELNYILSFKKTNKKKIDHCFWSDLSCCSIH